MRESLYPWQSLSIILSGVLNEQQQRVIEYLKAENQILREQMGKKRFRFNDSQRRRLAVLGKAIGRKAHSEICFIVTLDTIFRWHRTLIAQKYDGSKSRRVGRPGIMREIRELIVRMATEMRLWDTSGSRGRCVRSGTVSHAPPSPMS